MTKPTTFRDYAFILVLLPLAPIVLTPAYAAADPYYAGYYYCGGCNLALQGVYGDIYTVNPYVPYFDHFAQWVNVQFSYSPNYWTQVGFLKCGGLAGCPTDETYYCEFNNGNEFLQTFNAGPSQGSTHWYEVYYATGDSWTCLNDNGNTVTWPTSWSSAIDLSAFSESTNTCIVIDGTHFSSLEFYYYGSGWYNWAEHIAHADSPYSVNPISNQEFTASGGTGC